MNTAELVERYELHTGFDPSAPEGAQCFAFYEEVPGCLALGKTREEAVGSLKSMIWPFIDLMRRDGAEPPPPAVGVWPNVSFQVESLALKGRGASVSDETTTDMMSKVEFNEGKLVTL